MSTRNSTNPILSFRPGDEFFHGGRNYIIMNILDLGHFLAKDWETGKIREISVKDLLRPEDLPPVRQAPDLSQLPSRDWEKAQGRLKVIEPLLEGDRSIKAIKDRAREAGIHFNTLYRWLLTYERERLLSALVRKGRGDSGKSRLSEEVEVIVTSAIEEIYLTSQRKPVRKVIDAVRKRCMNAGFEAPHPNTVRNRIDKLDDRKKVAARSGKRKAREIYSAIQGSFPGAVRPLAYVQIDHTRLDIQVVDEVHRLPMGRPWITVAIDVFSRMILGFHITMDPPSSMSIGFCLSHACFPKDEWLALRKIEGSWPCWGLMEALHADNGSDFRSEALIRACQEYGIRLEWRPVKRPEFGGHIERLIGTLVKEIHTLPGTTFSNPRERGKYDSEKTASFTLPELEKWLGTFIVGVYHKRNHSSIGMSPEEMFELGIHGTKEIPGIGLPRLPSDERRFRLDFMPIIKRTVQRYGVAVDGIHYGGEPLQRWINAADPDNKRSKRFFVFKRDPRDISRLWFLDPELNQYFEIPYRDMTRPSISIWDLKESRRKLKEEGRTTDEKALFETYEKLDQIETEAVTRSKKARRKGHQKQERESGQKASTRSAPNFGDEDSSEIAPFESKRR